MAGERGYLAYLVRLWAVHDDGELVWRASAEDAHTGERRAFADLAGLCAFLQESAGQVLADAACEARPTMERGELP
jgi:hypothetical protein